MSLKVRELAVLGEFRPFGLSVEYADGGEVDPAVIPPEKYQYQLFGPEVTHKTASDPLSAGADPSGSASAGSSAPEFGEHELFVRGNRIIWSMGTRVYKRYTAESAVLMVRWCRMDSISEPVLCALQADCLSFYTAQGDVFCTPLPYYVAAIWPSKTGLLIQKAADVSRASSTSSPPLHGRDISRPSKEHGLSHFKPPVKDDPAMVSSLLVLNHPLEEPQATYFEDRGKLCLMKDFEEKVVWTSDQIPLMASYNRGKHQYSLWHANMIGSSSSVSTVHFSFRRIWQGKSLQSPANKVFMAIDMDAMPVLYFLFSEQKTLLGIRLHIDEENEEGITDIKPLTTWSLPAVDASPVLVTRPRVRAGPLPFTDVIILGAENHLFLYSGQHCLCRYVLPFGLGKDFATHGLQPLRNELKIVGVKDFVEGRINVACSNGQVFRCALRRYPFSSLVNDCITVMAEGLQFSYYKHFLSLLWGGNNSSYLTDSNFNPDQEWESFSSEVTKICNKYVHSPPKSNNPAHSIKEITAWDFLLSSKFHAQYKKKSPVSLLSILAYPGPTAGLYNNNKCNYGGERGSEELSYRMHLVEMSDSLHALYESLKLNILRKKDMEHLAFLLCTVSVYLGKTKYIDYYCRDFPEILNDIIYNPPSVTDDENINILTHSDPPSVFHWLETSLKNGCKSNHNSSNIPSLMCNSKSSVVGWARKVLSFYSLLLGAERDERDDGVTLSSGVHCEIANGSARSREEIMVLAMVAEKFGRQHLDMLPVGVSLPLRHALDICRDSPPLDWPAAAYVLIGREDLARAKLRKEHGSQSSSDLVSLSVPYMLQLQPVTVPPSLSEPTLLEASGSEDSDSPYRNVEDGMEHIFNSTTQLRYGRDLRLNEVRRLLSSSRPVAIQMSINPSASDQEVQQAKLWNLAQRTTALPFGRGAFTLSTTYTLLTETLLIPKLVLAGRLPAQQNATVNLDPNIRNISELSSWPEFHNGVAAGLRLAPLQGKMLRSWIQYNKPEEPSFTHAGLLFALGLHGHLKVLANTDAYRYLSEEHDVTSAGLLLGLAASHRGTMYPEISKTLNVHIPSRQPDVELPTLLQVAALMGIGLLFENSAHPLTMKMLLGEIGRRSSGENVLEWEGYAVAAGSALGLVALGRGASAFNFTDSFVDQLLLYMGTKGFYLEKSGKALPRDEQIRNSGPVIDGKQVNFYVTAPGATIALALIFLKTESEEIAKQIYIPTTHFDLQYVRPDFIMLRIIARSLIMWSRVQPSREWVEAQVPEFIRVVISKSRDDSIIGDEFELEDVCQAFVNIITGACISLGLKYAGTKNGDVQELLYNYAVYFLNEMKHLNPSNKLLLPKGLLQQVDRATLELSVHLITLSLSLVMAGSGHLQTFRLLRYLRSRSSAEGHMNYGLQMAVSLSIGFLFLGGGMQTFSTSNSAIAALLLTLYPRLPTGPNDNRCHLQAFRHLYVLAAESRWVQTIDVDTGLPVYCPLEVTVTETDFYRETTYCEVTPCVLPERSVLKSVQVCGPRYWSQFIELEPEDKPWWKAGDRSDPFNDGVLYIKRKVGSCPYADDPIGCQSLLSRAMHKVSGVSCSTIAIGNNNAQDSSIKVDQLVSTFSADPSLIAFAKLCCESSGHSCDPNFKEFCLQVLYECVSKDRPALLQVYLFLYTMIEAMWEQVKNRLLVVHDSIFLSNIKVALAYGEALLSGRLSYTNGGGIIQPTFIESLRKRIEDVFKHSHGIQENISIYLSMEQWPNNDGKRTDAVLLAWYLLWYSIPPPIVVKSVLKKIPRGILNDKLSVVPLLRLLLPTTCQKGIIEIEKFLTSLGG